MEWNSTRWLDRIKIMFLFSWDKGVHSEYHSFNRKYNGARQLYSEICQSITKFVQCIGVRPQYNGVRSSYNGCYLEGIKIDCSTLEFNRSTTIFAWSSSGVQRNSREYNAIRPKLNRVHRSSAFQLSQIVLYNAVLQKYNGVSQSTLKFVRVQLSV